MATPNINDTSTFQTIENNVTENNMFSPALPMSVNNTEPTTSSDSISVENIVTPAPVTSSSSLHSILMNNNTSNVVSSTSLPVSSANHNHVIQTNLNHTTKPQLSTNQPATIINNDQILTKTRLQDLVKEVDPCEQLDEEVEDLLLQLVDDFVNSTVNTACTFAKHRNASTVEIKDVQLYLEKMYNMWIPGFGTDEVKPYKKPPITEAHKQRLALIRKSLKKY
ncbi:hypothetical protein PGB90_006191 [Kerria lacca]